MVVFIDDEEDICEIFKDTFEDDYKLEVFVDSKQALEFIENNEVKLIISDYRMPGFSGVELAEKLTKKIPFYICTGELGLENEFPGVTGIVNKPIDMFKIEKMIKEHLS